MTSIGQALVLDLRGDPGYDSLRSGLDAVTGEILPLLGSDEIADQLVGLAALSDIHDRFQHKGNEAAVNQQLQLEALAANSSLEILRAVTLDFDQKLDKKFPGEDLARKRDDVDAVFQYLYQIHVDTKSQPQPATPVVFGSLKAMLSQSVISASPKHDHAQLRRGLQVVQAVLKHLAPDQTQVRS